jgi:alpha-1,3-rhamnosyl/mannosyltransferase
VEELSESDLRNASRGTVIAIGRMQDELPALYSGALALAVPSLYESAPFPPLEAMACGTPVICSDGGGLPEEVGDAGLVLPVRDVAAWTEALTMISEQESLRHRLADAGHAMVSHRSWREAALQYVEIYREVVG